MVKDIFGHEHPPSSCCAAPILSLSGPGFEHLICDNCKRVIKDITPKDTPRPELSDEERARLDTIVPPPSEITNEELFMKTTTNDELRGKLSEIVRYNGFNLSNDEAVDALLQLIHQHTEQAVREAKVETIGSANESLYNLLPSGSVDAFAILKAIETWQTEMTERIAQLTTNHKGEDDAE